MTTGEIKAILLKIFILAFLLSNIENTAATLMGQQTDIVLQAQVCCFLNIFLNFHILTCRQLLYAIKPVQRRQHFRQSKLKQV